MCVPCWFRILISRRSRRRPHNAIGRLEYPVDSCCFFSSLLPKDIARKTTRLSRKRETAIFLAMNSYLDARDSNIFLYINEPQSIYGLVYIEQDQHQLFNCYSIVSIGLSIVCSLTKFHDTNIQDWPYRWRGRLNRGWSHPFSRIEYSALTGSAPTSSRFHHFKSKENNIKIRGRLSKHFGIKI